MPLRRLLLLSCIGSLAACSELFFVPAKDMVRTPASLGLEYRDVGVDVAHGVQLRGWLLEGIAPVKGTVVFLHGNAQNISYHLASVDWLPQRHYNVFIYDYRGYGESSGRPSIATSVTDFPFVMDALQAMLPAAQRRYVVFGQSLGGSFAIAQVARYKDRYPIKALIVDSGFAGFRRIAREKLHDFALTRPFDWLLQWLFPDQPDVLRDVARIHPLPLLIIHGLADTIVPARHAELLFQHASQPKALWLIPGVGHIRFLSAAAGRDRLARYLDARFDRSVSPNLH